MLKKIKRFLIGKSLPNWEYKHQRLSKRIALAVFSSDSMSSVAYATEEIALVLITAGTAALVYSFPIALVILFLLWILVTSYRQTIHAYPKGGGAYIVAKENLGTNYGLVAAGALLLDYILTVAVSVAAGVAALTSVFPNLFVYKVLIGVIVILIITLINHKGIKESGVIFAVPTYMFIISFLIMIGVGFFKFFIGTLTPVVIESQIVAVSNLSFFLILRAFSSGCAALTGIEAISDGVPAFKEPESKNARKTLLIMAVILSVLFFGITFLGYFLKVVPVHDRTLVSLIAEGVFGKTVFFYIIQAFTMLILFLAANTSFADFPRLCFFLAKDKFLPAQFKQLGERLVFSTGITFLGIAASVLIIMFGGSVHHLIPLYAVGVFTSFTLSQSGMVVRHFKIKEKGWKRSATINLIGAIMSFIVLLIIGYTKFIHGAWIIIVLIFVVMIIFKKINEHYTNVADQLSISDLKRFKKSSDKHLLVVMIPSFHKGVINAINFAKTFSNNVVAVHVKLSNKDTENLLKYWKKFKPGPELVLIESPYRKLMEPLMAYLDELEKDKKLNVTVVIPEFVPKQKWHNILHDNTGRTIRRAVHARKRTSFISVQYHLEK